MINHHDRYERVLGFKLQSELPSNGVHEILWGHCFVGSDRKLKIENAGEAGFVYYWPAITSPEPVRKLSHRHAFF